MGSSGGNPLKNPPDSLVIFGVQFLYIFVFLYMPFNLVFRVYLFEIDVSRFFFVEVWPP